VNASVTLRLLFTLALRNVRAHWVKSFIVGGILFFGTFLVVLGSSLLDTIEASMQRSITSSLSGHIQLYDSKAKDALALFGGFGATVPEVGEVPDYEKVASVIEAMPEVDAVVPMGIVNVTLFNGTELDRVLDKLRAAVKVNDTVSEGVLGEQIRGIAATLRKDVEAQSTVAADKGAAETNKAALDRVMSDAFWAEFQNDPLASLDFLDTTVAPIASDGRMLYIRLLGTNLDTYQQHFDRFRIVDGTPVPDGHRGILFSKKYYETWVKNKVARELDQVRDAMKRDEKTLAEDGYLRDRIARNARQYQRILFQLSPADTEALTTELRTELGDTKGDLPTMLQSFLAFDDGNFEDRYAWFYAHVAPRIRLYEAPVGETDTLRAYTKSGYVRAVNVKVYGTFNFDGLETSDLASAVNLCDLITFRSLYGKMSGDQQAELSEIKTAVGVKDVSRANAEDELFGGSSGDLEGVGTVETSAAIDALRDATFRTAETASDEDRTYSEKEMDDGLVLNIAVILKDPERIAQGLAAIQAKLAGSDLSLQAVDWQQASGIVGQLILVLKFVLFLSIFIIFLVALVIINNAMVMATVERVTEIGTMRAIGAQRPWVIGLFLIETVVLGTVAGTLGALAAAMFVGYLGIVGIPAPMDAFVLLFAGPRLYPLCGADNFAFGVISVMVISVLSALYPAFLAARVQPVVAMAQKE